MSDWITYKRAVAAKRKLIDKRKAEVRALIELHAGSKQRLVAKQERALKDLLKQCTHDEVEHRTAYYEGGYDYHATTDHWDICLLCGAKLNETTESHNWYG
jgi:hypothetical protein